MKKIIFILITVLVLLACKESKSSEKSEDRMNKKYSEFWTYFKSVEGKAENISKMEVEEQRELLYNLKREISKVDSNLDVEFSDKELFITAHGIKTSFPSVKDLAESAPDDLGWTVTAFKQRKNLPFSLKFDQSFLLNSDDILFKVRESGEYLDVVIFFSGQDGLQDVQKKQVIFEFLDGILGEYDTETYIGLIDIDSGPDSDFVDAEKFREIVENFKKKRGSTE